MARTAVAGEDAAVGCHGDRGQAAQRLAVRLRQQCLATGRRFDRGEPLRRARKQSTVGMESERADIAVELRQHRAPGVIGAAQPPDFFAGRYTDRAVRRFGDGVGARYRVANWDGFVEPIVGAEGAIH